MRVTLPKPAINRGLLVLIVAILLGVSHAHSSDPALSVVKVWPDKLFFATGEDVGGTVTIKNSGAASQRGTLSVFITNDLDTPSAVQTKTVTVAANSEQKVSFTWPAKQVQRYGHAMVAELEAEGQVTARAEEYFGSAKNVWEVGIAGNHPVAFTAAHVKSMTQIEGAVDMFRSKYTNTFEKFFWAPDDFANMTPTQKKWFSGQARYHEQADRLKHMCEYGAKIGVLPTTYGKSIGSGTGARDFILENPEMVYGFGGRMNFSPDTEELAKWDVDSEKYWQSTGWAHYNMNDPAVVQHGINEIIASSEMFGWHGVRFDGHFRARTGRQRVGEKVVNFTRDMADRQTAANTAALKRQVRVKFPNYVFGYNAAECAFGKRLIENPREMMELCAGGGHIMDEYAKQNEGGAHPFRNWQDYAHMLAEQTEQVRRLGGHLFPMVHGRGVIARYQEIFVLAAGAHPNATTWAVDHPYHAFATRYSAVLWHEELQNVWNPTGLVMAPPGVMWTDFVREHEIDAKRRRLIVHLVNPPAQATATESVAAMKELARRDKERKAIAKKAAEKKIEPDYSSLDRLPPVKLFPEPQLNVPVRLAPRALRGNWQLDRALLLAPETCTQHSLDVDTSDPYFWQVNIAKLPFWAVIVFELERSAQ